MYACVYINHIINRVHNIIIRYAWSRYECIHKAVIFYGRALYKTNETIIQYNILVY